MEVFPAATKLVMYAALVPSRDILRVVSSLLQRPTHGSRSWVQYKLRH